VNFNISALMTVFGTQERHKLLQKSHILSL